MGHNNVFQTAISILLAQKVESVTYSLLTLCSHPPFIQLTQTAQTPSNNLTARIHQFDEFALFFKRISPNRGLNENVSTDLNIALVE